MDAYPQNPRTNVLSIVALVTSVLGMAIVPVILGHVSLSQIKKTGEQGRVMAIIGLILGYLGIAGYLIILAIVLISVVGHGMSVASQ